MRSVFGHSKLSGKMNRYIVYLGFISCLVIGSLGAESVMVSNDIMVKPSPLQITQPTDKVTVTLNCTGSRSDLSYYIKNRIKWTFQGPDQTKEYMFSLGFYLSEHMDKSKFKIEYAEVSPGTGTGGFFTALIISGVTRADDGIYKCSLIGENLQVIDSKEVRLTVVNPVQTVALKLYDAQDKLIKESNPPFTKNSPSVKITPGNYKVTCDAQGSNPEPIMNLFLNEMKPYVSITTEEDNSAQYKSYNGRFQVKSLVINAHNAPQALVCEANIAGDFYDPVEAGINLLVTIDKPAINCLNATAAVGDRNSKIMCTLTAEGNNDALLCDNVSWLLGNNGESISYDQRWKDEEYDIIEAKCEKSADGLKVTLDLFTIKPVLFKETFFLVYGKAENAHRHPITLHDITTGAAGIITPLSLLACLVMAVISKHLARL